MKKFNKSNEEEGFTPTPIKKIGVSSQSERGFIETIILIIVGLALLKYFFDWSIFDAATSEEGKSTIIYIRDIFNAVWSYIGAPVIYIWNEIVRPILELGWQSFQALIEWGRDNAQQGV